MILGARDSVSKQQRGILQRNLRVEDMDSDAGYLLGLSWPN